MQQWHNKIDPILKDFIQAILILDTADPPRPEDLPIFTNGMPALLLTSQNRKIICRCTERPFRQKDGPNGGMLP